MAATQCTPSDQELASISLAVRSLSIDGVEKANSGHPGLPMGAADFASYIWAKHLRFNPKDPNWVGRDRFVLSAGHGCMLWYSLLHLFGYNLSLDELKSFRQWESKTPGHPEYGITPGVETTTGPLGQGFANGVGIALSGKMLAERYSKDLFGFRVFGLVSDGDLMEGISYEAASLAGHLKLGNLIYLYDDNKISLAGKTDECFTELTLERFKAHGWHVEQCNGNSFPEIDAAVTRAMAVTDLPKLICMRTVIGYGSPHKANTHEVHGAPLGKDELAATKKNLGLPEDKSFYIPPAAAAATSRLVEQKVQCSQQWGDRFESWRSENAALASQLDAQLAKEVPQKLKDALIGALKEHKKDATRNLSSVAIQTIAANLPNFIGGAADLEPSTKTSIKGAADITSTAFGGRNFRFGVREHAMGGIVNGLAYQQAWFPFGSTFLVFSDYMRAPIRVAAISHLQSLFIFTHDSFWVGEDGPTHQPIEHLAALRAIPNLNVYRPADGLEVAMCYWSALNRKNGPSALIFTRQNLPQLARAADFSADQILKGGYLVRPGDGPALIATGSEVSVAIEAADILAKDGVNCSVVSVPCLEELKKQGQSYLQALIPGSKKRVVIEAGIAQGWAEVAGSDALFITMEHFGASAPGELLADKFGFTASKVAERVKSWLC